MNARECLARAALALGRGHTDYAAAACEQILGVAPGHLRALMLLGQARLAEERFDASAQVFEEVLRLDPENTLARAGLAASYERLGRVAAALGQLRLATELSPGNPEVQQAHQALEAQLRRGRAATGRAVAKRARALLVRGRLAEAEAAFHESLLEERERDDLRLGRLRALWRAGRGEDVRAACRELRAEERLFPAALAIEATVEMAGGDPALGTELLHEARCLDPSDLVVGPIVREGGFELSSLDEAVEVGEPTVPCPPEVAALSFGAMEGALEEPTDEALLSAALGGERAGDAHDPGVAEVRRVLEAAEGLLGRGLGFRVSGSGSGVVGVGSSGQVTQGSRASAGRGAEGGTLAILAQRGELRARFGPAGADLVDAKLRALVSALEAQERACALYYVDEAQEVAGLTLPPVARGDQTAMARFVTHLAGAAEAQGGALGHVLLVGGPEMMPFARVANPADDDDAVVETDLPLACQGANLLLPVRSVARLPAGAAGGPQFLIQSLDAMRLRLESPARPASAWRWWRGFGGGRRAKARVFALSARVWRASTEALLEQLEVASELRLSPPVVEEDFEAEWLKGVCFALFNLHGVDGADGWFGQKDGSYPADYPLFPVALRSASLEGIDLEGAIVFTEACYGGSIADRRPDNSVALALLSRGAACVVCSTCIAYGSVAPPLSGADLLARFFWLHLEQGQAAGEALWRAKRDFLDGMRQRQGYLDGDDQKTLLSFVLYGDPLARMAAPDRTAEVTTFDEQMSAAHAVEGLSLFCRARSAAMVAEPPSGDLVAMARRLLANAVPEAADGPLDVLPRGLCERVYHEGCQDCEPPDAAHSQRPGAYVVSSRKSLPLWDGGTLRRVARVTLDTAGTVLKLSVSK